MKSTVLEYLEKTAEKCPEKIAYADLSESYTFSSIVETAKRIGSYIAKSVKPHNPVVVYMKKAANNIPAFFGAVYAGCYYVPIDSQMPLDRIKLILGTLNPSLILYDATTEDNLSGLDSSIPSVSYESAIESNIDKKALGEIRENSKNTDLLYVLFTSGSTGVPKGVTISHAAVSDFMEWICSKYGLDETISLCNQAPFYFDASVPDLYIPIISGASVYIPPKMYYAFPQKILQFIVEKNINTLIWVPSALCNVVNCKAFELVKPTSIRLVIFCGEVMPCRHLNAWRKAVPNALYVNMYGPTEATYACMYYNINCEFQDDEVLPLGRACENSEILLITDDNKIADEGEIGEICVLGQCLSSGYYNAPDKTANAFVQNPTNDKWNELMYRTGDLAYKKGNELIFAGRKDFQIKRLGHRIELGEIENVILSIDSVENACCVFNNNTNEIIAVYTGNVDEDKMIGIISEKLPHYMLPSGYKHLERMPMNINGKIDRVRLNSDYGEKQ